MLFTNPNQDEEDDLKSPLRQLTFGPDPIEPKTQRLFSWHQFVYSMVGLVFGFAGILTGVILFFHGIIEPDSSFVTSVLGMNVEMSDAPPGVVLFFVGLFVIYVTRYSVRTGKTK